MQLSNRLTFSLASLIVLMIAGFAFLIPGTAEAVGTVTFDDSVDDQTFTVQKLITPIGLPTATSTEAADTLTYVLNLVNADDTLTAISDGADLVTDLGLSYAEATRLISGTPTLVGDALSFRYVVTATDSDSETDTDMIDFTITVVTDISFGTKTINDITVKVGDIVSETLPTATNGIGGDLTYELFLASDTARSTAVTTIAGLTFTGANQSLVGRATVLPATEYVYRATENSSPGIGADSGQPELEFTVTVSMSSSPAFAATAEIDDISEMVGTTLMDGTNAYVLLPVATDADGDMLTHELTPATDGTPDLPDGLSLQHGALPGEAGMRYYIEGTITGVMAETEFTWTASDKDASTDDATLTFDITTTAGAAPAAPTAMLNSATDHANSLKIDVSWAAPTDGSASAVANYTLLDGEDDSVVQDDIDGTSHQVTKMAADRGTEFTFKVRANYSTGMSEASEASSVTIPILSPAKPAAPSAMKNSDDDLVIDVSWTAPDDTGGDDITGYTIKKYLNGTLVKTFPDDDPSTTEITGTSYEVGPVPIADRGMEFTFGVIAMNETGDSDESDMSGAYMVPTAAPTVPAITSATPDAVNKKITLAWNAPADPGGLAVTYTVNQTGVVTAQHDAGSETTLEITSLAPGAYTFTVTATNSKGSATSPEASATLPAPPTTTDNIPPTFGSTTIATIAATVDTAITAQILPQADDPDGDNNEITYELENLPDGLTFDDDSRLLSGTPTAAQDATVYTYTATDEEGDTASLKFIIQIAAIVPGAPGNVAATADQTANTISLTWDAPAKTGGTAITGYVVMMDGTAVTDDDDTTDRMYTTGMLSAGDYAFTVAATNSVGTGAASSAVSETITPEDANPTVAVTTPPDLDLSGLFTATLTFSKAVDALTADDLTVTGGSVVGAPGKNTDGTVWTVVIQPDDGVTEVVIAVSDTIASGTLSHTIKPPAGATPGRMLNAGKYLVIVRDADNVPNFGTANPALLEWADMPNLERLFDVGGTLQLKVTGATRLQVVFSEVMWAVDERNVGNAAYTSEQWIELHNRSGKNFEISGITLAYKEGRPALAEETDRISNVVDGGADWVIGKGQNGNSGAADGTGMVEFISMYRNNEGEPGHQASRWTKSTELYATNHRGTPGMKERTNVPTITTTNVFRAPIIFNEIGNHSNPDYEWIELKNVSGGNVNLKNYEVTMVTTKGANQPGHNDVDLIDFTGADRNVPAGGILLVVKSDPTGDPNHPLAAGWNFGARNTWTPAKPGEANYVRGVNENSARYMVASTFNEMPDGDFVLILRNRQDRNGKPDDPGLAVKDNNIRDIAGYVPDNGLKVDTAALFTNLWPLHNFGAPWYRNEFNNGTVHRRQHAGTDGTKRSRTDRDHVDDAAFRDIGWTGIGYKRNAEPVAENGGTPGHPDSADPRHHKHDTVARSSIIVNEVMPSVGPRNVPEWIELYNTSTTNGVSVNKWRITITNHDQDSADGAAGSFDGDLSISFTLDADVIPPRQPYLIVARSGRNTTNLPNDRIHTVGRRASQLLLNPYGFQIKVEAWEKDNVYHHVETIGNLGAAPANNRRPDAQSFEPIAWELPATMDDDNNRVSLVRVSGSMGAVPGMQQGAWKLFDMSKQIGRTLDATYYGHVSDLGSPGHVVGGVLPVSLSKFRPERLATGEVVVRWVTESELDNAGFNILRSEALDGEFTKLNTKLIAGKGTTSEKNAYEFVDTSAKPNVVYYYQIQDVSLDGDVTTLKTTHLRGNISVVGKLTTTWGGLKALQ